MDTQCRKFFNLESAPFGETPDPTFFFESPSHTQALSQLLRFVAQGRGFGLLTGEVGMGKTLLSRLLLKRLAQDCSTALILFPKLDECELLQSICEEFEILTPTVSTRSLKVHLDLLNEFVLQASSAGRRCVLLIDEAQGLSSQALEAIRLLSNLETERDKLLQIIILGQPELKKRLTTPELRQFAQRIGLSLDLKPFTPEQTERYIKHRLHVAGASHMLRFDPKAIPLIHHASGGLPRQINRICEGLLLSAYERQVRFINHAFVKAALAPQPTPLISRLFPGRTRNSKKTRLIA